MRGSKKCICEKEEIPMNDDSHLSVTRQSLVQRLHVWDDDVSWRRFFERYWQLIYNVARSAGLSDADSQDVVIYVCKKINNYRSEVGSFRKWLRVVTRSRIIDRYRKEKRHQNGRKHNLEDSRKTPHMERQPDPMQLDIERIYEKQWAKAVVDAALVMVRGKVKPRHYQIYDSVVLKEWAPRDVADMFGISVPQVYLIRHRVGKVVEKAVRLAEQQVL